MKRLFAICVIVLFSLLGGCGQVSETPTPDYIEVTPDNTPDKIPQWPVDLTREPSSVTPLMWRVTAPGGQTMVLFGSIHAADEALYPLPLTVTDALYSCEYLAVEADIAAFEEDMAALMAMTMSMMYQDGKTVADEIGAELHERIKTVLAELESELELGFSVEMLDNFKPYMWNDLLGSIALERSGLSYELGLDRYFLYEAAVRGMEVLEIEAMSDQIEMLLGFSPPLQAAMLEGSLDIDAGALALRELYRLWKEGDEQTIEEFLTAEDESEDFPEELAEEYTDAMLTQRNIGMAEAAKRYIAEGKAVFYVVGLSHLLGEDSVIDLLRQSGYTVERMPV